MLGESQNHSPMCPHKTPNQDPIHNRPYDFAARRHLRHPTRDTCRSFTILKFLSNRFDHHPSIRRYTRNRNILICNSATTNVRIYAIPPSPSFEICSINAQRRIANHHSPVKISISPISLPGTTFSSRLRSWTDDIDVT